MVVLRSLAFNIAFYINIVLWMLAALPLLLLPRRFIMSATRGWARSNLFLMRWITGIKVEVRHRERVPQGGALIASKHQSFWETFALYLVFPDPVFVLKRELTWIPLFGWYARKAGCVAVDRDSSRPSTLLGLIRESKQVIKDGRQLLIFPEGTRQAPGAPASYKKGIVHIYTRLGMPCVPVALNSGLFWPRRKFIRYPGTLVVDILETIPADLQKDAFFTQMQDRIEAASTQLIEEARRKDETAASA